MKRVGVQARVYRCTIPDKERFSHVILVDIQREVMESNSQKPLAPSNSPEAR